MKKWNNKYIINVKILKNSMKVLLIIISLYLLFFIPISFWNYDTGKKVTIKNKKYSFKYVYKKLDSIIDIKSKNSFRKKKLFMKNISKILI